MDEQDVDYVRPGMSIRIQTKPGIVDVKANTIPQSPCRISVSSNSTYPMLVQLSDDTSRVLIGMSEEDARNWADQLLTVADQIE